LSSSDVSIYVYNTCTYHPGSSVSFHITINIKWFYIIWVYCVHSTFLMLVFQVGTVLWVVLYLKKEDRSILFLTIMSYIYIYIYIGTNPRWNSCRHIIQRCRRGADSGEGQILENDRKVGGQVLERTRKWGGGQV
jgi:hypothetical protein